jgi:hypothetical protein
MPNLDCGDAVAWLSLLSGGRDDMHQKRSEQLDERACMLEVSRVEHEVLHDDRNDKLPSQGSATEVPSR